jgi:hypothetical protein
MVDDERGLLQKVDNKYVANDSSPGLVGGGGKDFWKFKAANLGKGSLVFSYK